MTDDLVSVTLEVYSDELPEPQDVAPRAFVWRPEASPPRAFPFKCTWRTERGDRREATVNATDHHDARRGARELVGLRGDVIVPGSLAVQQVRP